MQDLSFHSLANQYRDSLLEEVIPFWLNHSLDREYGGYFTCLTRDGSVFDTDKFMWLQGRQIWMFSKLCNQLGTREEWLQAAKLGVDFIKKHGRDEKGDFYFSLNRQGQPLIQPYNIFSDCFAAMAFSQYSLASGDQEAGDLARSTYNRILARKDNPKGQYNKVVPGTRPMEGFALPMILCNLTLELENVLDPALVERTIDECLYQIMERFYVRELDLVLENLDPQGKPVDSYEGRLVLPGHAIEGMWFVMDLARRRGDQRLAANAVAITLRMLEYGWDKEYEGILYFMDREGHPPQQLEWDQKLWWVHIETLIALAYGYELTGSVACAEWYRRVHAYTWAHFPDPQGGEWYGYLNRRGEILLPLKGGKFKGCFHVPRGLLKLWQIFSRLAERGGDW